MTKRNLAVSVCAGVLSLGAAGTAGAAELQPVAQSVPPRVHQLVPLGADGARVALNATDPKNGAHVTGDEYLARDDIYLANADGTDLRAVWRGVWGSSISGLTASADGSWVGFINDHEGAYMLSTATGKGEHLHGTSQRPAWAVTGFISGSDALYATTDGGQVWQINPSGDLEATGWVGQGLRRKVTQQRFALSPTETRLGACTVLRAHGHSEGFRLGYLDTAAGVFRWRVLALRASPPLGAYDQATCGVADDANVVVTLGRRAGKSYAEAVVGSRAVSVRVPAWAVHVGSVSPSGRYVLIGSAYTQYDVETYIGLRGYVLLGERLAIVDLQTGRTVQVSGLKPYTNARLDAKSGFVSASDAVWSADETHLGIGSERAGAFVINTHTGRSRHVPVPAPPVGFSFGSRRVFPLGFSADGRRFAFALSDASEDITSLHPYSVAIGGGPATYLLTPADNSFQNVVRSADGARTWVVSSSTCHSEPRYAAFNLIAGGVWDGPFTVAAPIATP